jgi:hypothetical protein
MFNEISSSRFGPTEGGLADATSLLSIHFVQFVQIMYKAHHDAAVHMCVGQFAWLV